MQETTKDESRVNGILYVAARVMIATFFIGKAIGLISDPNGMGQFLMQSNVPQYLLWPNVAFEFIAAFSIMIGLQTRLAAGLLAIYLFWSSYMLHFATGNIESVGMFWRDLALIGGLVLILSHRHSKFAIDNVLIRNADETAKDTAPVLEGDAIVCAPYQPVPAQ